ncbi:MAG: CHASE2 domain-containing protein [Desulforhopalus sp.]
MTGTKNKLIKIVWFTLLASMFWGGLAQLDPLGAKSAASFHSESLFLRFIGGPWYRSDAQGKITVVLIDDSYLEQIGSHWPMSYLDQDLLLNDILDYEPNSLFLDLLYRHKHGSDDELKQLVDTMANASTSTSSKRKIPVFIPYLINDAEGLDTCLPGVHSKAQIVQANSVIPEMQISSIKKTYIGWKGCGDRYPSNILGIKVLRTPAFALYEEYNKQTGSMAAKQSSSESDFRDPMMIHWGTGVSQSHKSALEIGGITCRSIDKDNSIDKLKYSVAQISDAFLNSLSGSAERGWYERCTYTDTIHATWFLGSSPENRKFLESMIKDRIVLVGTQVDGVPDTILSPVNGKIPGVYLFAMALDNYLEYGPEYYHHIGTVQKVAMEIGLIWIISLFVGILNELTATRQLNRIGKDVAGVKLGLIIFKGIFILILSLTGALLSWTFLKYAPMDWISVFFLSNIAAIINQNLYQNKWRGISFQSPIENA